MRTAVGMLLMGLGFVLVCISAYLWVTRPPSKAICRELVAEGNGQAFYESGCANTGWEK